MSWSLAPAPCSVCSLPYPWRVGRDAVAPLLRRMACVRWVTDTVLHAGQTVLHPPFGAGPEEIDLPRHDNALVAMLPRADRLRLVKHFEPVEMLLAQVLCEAGQPTRYVYFPSQAQISLMAQLDPRPVNGHVCLASRPGAERAESPESAESPERAESAESAIGAAARPQLQTLEVAMVGPEGMVGAHLLLGVVREPLQALVQSAGLAWRMAAAPFRTELARSKALQHCLQRYLYVLMAQRAAAAACLRFHEIGPRLARWLLMSQDRAHADHFPVTQEWVAELMGVRRVGVTTAAGVLRRQGLISYHRGLLTVLDRAGLEAASCSCYAADQGIYERTMLQTT